MARLTQQQILEIQKDCKEVVPELVLDGIWGPKTQAAVRKYLQTLKPKNNPWPAPDTSSLIKFYGSPGDESNLVTVKFPFRTFYEGRVVATFRCHKKVAASLVRILTRINALYGDQPGVMEEITDYDGVYNFRAKKGNSKSWSLHAYGAAIDYDADDNTYKNQWPTEADMDWAIIKEFAREGWTSAAAEWGYDAMHFEATNKKK